MALQVQLFLLLTYEEMLIHKITCLVYWRNISSVKEQIKYTANGTAAPGSLPVVQDQR
jgi:hypothetical protein